ncbi:MAG: tetratricopeptide repeat protein [Opitutales bacterium]
MSEDGKQWEEAAYFHRGARVHEPVYGDGKYLILWGGNVQGMDRREMLISEDGKNFRRVDGFPPNPSYNNERFSDPMFAGGRFAVFFEHYNLTSTDGENWSANTRAPTFPVLEFEPLGGHDGHFYGSITGSLRRTDRLNRSVDDWSSVRTGDYFVENTPQRKLKFFANPGHADPVIVSPRSQAGDLELWGSLPADSPTRHPLWAMLTGEEITKEPSAEVAQEPAAPEEKPEPAAEPAEPVNEFAMIPEEYRASIDALIAFDKRARKAPTLGAFIRTARPLFETRDIPIEQRVQMMKDLMAPFGNVEAESKVAFMILMDCINMDEKEAYLPAMTKAHRERVNAMASEHVDAYTRTGSLPDYPMEHHKVKRLEPEYLPNEKMDPEPLYAALEEGYLGAAFDLFYVNAFGIGRPTIPLLGAFWKERVNQFAGYDITQYSDPESATEPLLEARSVAGTQVFLGAVMADMLGREPREMFDFSAAESLSELSVEAFKGGMLDLWGVGETVEKQAEERVAAAGEPAEPEPAAAAAETPAATGQPEGGAYTVLTDEERRELRNTMAKAHATLLESIHAWGTAQGESPYEEMKPLYEAWVDSLIAREQHGEALLYLGLPYSPLTSVDLDFETIAMRLAAEDWGATQDDSGLKLILDVANRAAHARVQGSSNAGWTLFTELYGLLSWGLDLLPDEQCHRVAQQLVQILQRVQGTPDEKADEARWALSQAYGIQRVSPTGYDALMNFAMGIELSDVVSERRRVEMLEDQAKATIGRVQFRETGYLPNEAVLTAFPDMKPIFEKAAELAAFDRDTLGQKFLGGMTGNDAAGDELLEAMETVPRDFRDDFKRFLVFSLAGDRAQALGHTESAIWLMAAADIYNERTRELGESAYFEELEERKVSGYFGDILRPNAGDAVRRLARTESLDAEMALEHLSDWENLPGFFRRDFDLENFESVVLRDAYEALIETHLRLGNLERAYRLFDEAPVWRYTLEKKLTLALADAGRVEYFLDNWPRKQLLTDVPKKVQAFIWEAYPAAVEALWDYPGVDGSDLEDHLSVALMGLASAAENAAIRAHQRETDSSMDYLPPLGAQVPVLQKPYSSEGNRVPEEALQVAALNVRMTGELDPAKQYLGANYPAFETAGKGALLLHTLEEDRYGALERLLSTFNDDYFASIWTDHYRTAGRILGGRARSTNVASGRQVDLLREPVAGTTRELWLALGLYEGALERLERDDLARERKAHRGKLDELFVEASRLADSEDPAQLQQAWVNLEVLARFRDPDGLLWRSEVENALVGLKQATASSQGEDADVSDEMWDDLLADLRSRANELENEIRESPAATPPDRLSPYQPLFFADGVIAGAYANPQLLKAHLAQLDRAEAGGLITFNAMFPYERDAQGRLIRKTHKDDETFVELYLFRHNALGQMLTKALSMSDEKGARRAHIRKALDLFGDTIDMPLPEKANPLWGTPVAGLAVEVFSGGPLLKEKDHTTRRASAIRRRLENVPGVLENIGSNPSAWALYAHALWEASLGENGGSGLAPKAVAAAHIALAMANRAELTAEAQAFVEKRAHFVRHKALPRNSTAMKDGFFLLEHYPYSMEADAVRARTRRIADKIVVDAAADTGLTGLPQSKWRITGAYQAVEDGLYYFDPGDNLSIYTRMAKEMGNGTAIARAACWNNGFAPDDFAAATEQVQQRIRDGMRDHALTLARFVARANPGNPFGYELLADAHIWLQQPIEAFNAANRALAIQPRRVPALTKKAGPGSAMGGHLLAKEALDAAIALYENAVQARMMRAEMYTRLQHFEDAIADYSAALEGSPEDRQRLQIRFKRGQLYQQQIKKDAMVEDYLYVLRNTPPEEGLAPIAFVTGSHLHEMGDRDKDAIFALQIAKELGHQQAAQLLADAYDL